MPGLVPGIHVGPREIVLDISRCGAAWMAGTTPGHDDMRLGDSSETRVAVEPAVFPDSCATSRGEGAGRGCLSAR
ncbi:hypothetical protein M2321_000668 [Rhodoblastus acidophilus]|nr:hypothetical protein [Rhodoblastus acidophilus]